jgi:lipoprotein-anchoring transpeptidase ErfK/SrfK
VPPGYPPRPGCLISAPHPLGARALYLYQGQRDAMYRIHGTNAPGTIG